MKKCILTILFILMFIIIGDYFYSGWGKLNRFPIITFNEAELIYNTELGDGACRLGNYRQINKSHIRTKLQLAYQPSGLYSDENKTSFYCSIDKNNMLKFYTADSIHMLSQQYGKKDVAVCPIQQTVKYKYIQLSDEEADEIINLADKIKETGILDNPFKPCSVLDVNHFIMQYQNKFYSNHSDKVESMYEVGATDLIDEILDKIVEASKKKYKYIPMT